MFAQITQEAADCFERRTRDSGETYTTTKDGSPDWVRDLVHDAHGGDLLPDDWRYQAIAAALDYIADAGHDSADNARDDSAEFADSHVDVYTGARLAWLASNLNRAGYCDEAREEGLVHDDAGITDRIGIGQYVESEEVYSLVVDALEAHAAELEEVDA